jgi:ABC-type branched-subunit amino acid transport system ATPase component
MGQGTLNTMNQPLLTLRSVSKSFGGVRAVKDVSLQLEDNAMLAVIGPNGCGKSTLFNLVTGYLQPDSGTIVFADETINGLPLHAIARRGLVRKFQVPSVFQGLTVEENLQAAGAERSIAGLLAKTNLTGLGNKPAAVLSHGQKQWLELALCLATKPKLLLLDEPVAGMTKAEKLETVALVRRLKDQHGLAAILIEHDMDFVEALECPVAVMMEGAVVAQGTFDTVRQDANVRAAYLGQAHA